MTARKGSAALTTDMIGIPATPDVTKRFKPTGGVIIPISILTTIMMPKCIGSMPNSMAIGNTKGATITRRPDGSINWPPINKIIFTMIKKVIGPRPAERSELAIA